MRLRPPPDLARALGRLALLGCAGFAAAAAVADTTRPADPMAEVQRLIGDAACRSDADCRTIGVGHRACGGPLRYLPWSAWRTSAHALQRAATASRAAPVGGDAPTMSTCQVPVDPGARCVGAAAGAAAAAARPGTCQLRADAPAVR